jgi:hypothetical protein
MFSTSEIRAIEKGFRNIYSNDYSQEKVNVLWMIIPKGYAYSERKPSNAAVILVEVDEGISKEKREELMGLFSQFLLAEFKISPLDSVITVANSSFVNAFFDAQKKRIHPLYRPWISFKMISSGIISKISNGYFRLRVRY